MKARPKYCAKCGRTDLKISVDKTKSDFNRNGRTADGFSDYCRKCDETRFKTMYDVRNKPWGWTTQHIQQYIQRRFA